MEVNLDETSRAQRAERACFQLQAWREKGYAPVLHSTSDGWVLVLDMTHWGVRDIGERNRDMLLRFNTEICDTPEAAIEAALKVIQP